MQEERVFEEVLRVFFEGAGEARGGLVESGEGTEERRLALRGEEGMWMDERGMIYDY